VANIQNKKSIQVVDAKVQRILIASTKQEKKIVITKA